MTTAEATSAGRPLLARLLRALAPVAAVVGQEPGATSLQGRLRAPTDAFERQEVQAALDRNAGNKTRTAKQLGISVQGPLKKMGRLGIIN